MKTKTSDSRTIHRASSLRHGAWMGLLIVLVLMPALAACDPSAVEDFSFVALPTTNEDFKSPALIDVGNSPITMAGADLDGDGDTDVVVVNRLETVAGSTQPADPAAPGTISVLKNSGAGSLTVAAEFSVGVLPASILAGDLDGDTIADLVLLNNAGKNVSLFFNDGSGAFPTEQIVTFDGTAAQISLIDFNGDGSFAQDVLISVPSTDATLDPGFLVALVNDGAGNFTQQNVSVGNASVFPAPTRFVIGNWNAGVVPDVALIDLNNDAVISLTGNGDGTFAVATHAGKEFVSVGTRPAHIVTADFNGDGNADLAVSNSLGVTVSILPGQGNGSFTPDDTAEPMVGESGRPERLLTGAFTPSGVDIVVVQRTGSSITLLDGDGGGGFTAKEIVTDSDPFAIAGGDFDVDGNPDDFVLTESTRRLISVFAGNGDGTFVRTVVGFDTRTTFPLVLDLNSDGFDDLLVLHPNADQLAVLLNCHPAAATACP